MSLLLLFRPRSGEIVTDPCVLDFSPLGDSSFSISPLADGSLVFATLADDVLVISEAECTS